MEEVKTLTKFQRALDFATAAHESIGQKRKYTFEPYINHPIAVSRILAEVGAHEDVLCAALLHDVVEDVFPKNEYYCIEKIEEVFGILAARMVNDLTDVYTTEAFPNIRRKERKLLECYRISKISGEAKSIKLADLIDNTSSIVDNDPSFAKLYLEEKAEMLGVLTGGNQVLMNLAVKTLKEARKKINSF